MQSLLSIFLFLELHDKNATFAFFFSYFSIIVKPGTVDKKPEVIIIPEEVENLIPGGESQGTVNELHGLIFIFKLCFQLFCYNCTSRYY